MRAFPDMKSCFKPAQAETNKRMNMNIRRLSAWAAVLSLSLAMGMPTAHAEDKTPVNLRAVGGANLGGTWNVCLAGLGKLVNDR